MKINTEYDLICTGEGISVYVLAALASKYGLSVLLIDEAKSNNSCLEYYSSFSESKLIQSIFEDLELDDFLKYQKTKDAVQIILNKKRFIISFDQNKTAEEIKREYFNKSENIIQYFNKFYNSIRVYPEFFEESFSLSQSNSNINKIKKIWKSEFRSVSENKHYPIRQYKKNSSEVEIEYITKVLLSLFGFSSPMNMSYEQMIRSIPIILSGSYKLEGSPDILQTILKSYIEGCGNDIRNGISIESIVTDLKGKNITGVLLDNYEGIVHSKNLVIGKNHYSLISKLPQKLRDANTRKQFNKVQPIQWVYYFDINILKSAIPIGTTHLMVKIIDENAEFNEENFMTIELSELNLDNSQMRVSVLLDYKLKTINPEYLKKVSSRMMRSLNELFPFIKDNIISIVPNFIDSNNLKIYKELKDIPNSLLRFHVQGGKLCQGYWGIPWQSNIENLFFIGKECWPSLGRYGEVLSAYNVAKTILIDRNLDKFKKSKNVNYEASVQ